MILFLLIEKDDKWTIRIDSPHGIKEFDQKHIHIKHKKLKNKIYSWNIDGSRHDKHKFPINEKFIEKAKEIASKKLNVDKDILQFVCYINGKNHLSIINYKRILNKYYIKKDNIVFIFLSNTGFIIIDLNNSELN